ncbi:hypothetical protein F4781DRAFT_443090 [Annulohypoxylon bovei var. microspora]|nr:hypothetical protein F4781DRAFT_443090 [Annulohypoxylon bovei var. microspora]
MPSVPNQYEGWAPVVGSESGYVEAHRNPPPAPAPVKESDGGSHSSVHSPRFGFGALARRLLGQNHHTESRSRRQHRSSRHGEHHQQREEREFQQRVQEGRASGQAAEIRRASQAAAANRQPLPDAQIYLLAALEGAHIDRPGHRKRLGNGLVVRLTRYENEYYFLASNGYYYKSTHKYGQGNDLDFVVDTWVPLTVRMFAQPYRQMCRR